jgi:hypothetical protein
MIPTSRTIQPASAAPAGHRDAAIWRTLDERLARADVAGVLANKLGPIAARSMRHDGRPVPKALETEARLAKTAWISAIPLLNRIRSVYDGPVLLIKGPEVAARYPERARSFMDVDVLAADPHALHAAMRADGCVLVDDPEIYENQDQHHLRPVQWPDTWLRVEIHVRPWWPEGSTAPPVEEIVAAAVPSATGVPGISAPHPAHHAIILASHAWESQPLETLRDLVDVAAVAAEADEGELTATARAWGIERIWRTTYGAATGLLGAPRRTAAVRIWARHLPAVRERSVLSNHLQRWLSPFWRLPPVPALRWIAAAFRQEIFPYPDESWRDKLIRVRYAFANPRAPMSVHRRAWREAAGAESQRQARRPRDPASRARHAHGHARGGRRA